MSDADDALRQLQISGMGQSGLIAEKLGLGNPSQWRGTPGKIWRQLTQIAIIRHRLTHGFDSLDPALIRAAGRFVLALVENRSWLEQQKVPDGSGGMVVLGDLIARQSRHPTADRRLYEELRERLDLSPKPILEKRKGILPTVSTLERAVGWL